MEKERSQNFSPRSLGEVAGGLRPGCGYFAGRCSQCRLLRRSEEGPGYSGDSFIACSRRGRHTDAQCAAESGPQLWREGGSRTRLPLAVAPGNPTPSPPPPPPPRPTTVSHPGSAFRARWADAQATRYALDSVTGGGLKPRSSQPVSG